MKIKRIKILSTFRGLPEGYQIQFSPPETSKDQLEPICFVGLNGSGKSNILEVIAEIFFYLETYHKANKKNLTNFRNPFGFEIEYYLPKIVFDVARIPWDELSFLWNNSEHSPYIRIIKHKNEFPIISAHFENTSITLTNDDNNRNEAILPYRVIGYSSGMNELLSNPFIKNDFHYFDEFQEKSGESEKATLNLNRLFFMSYASNNLIAVSNFLFDERDFDKNNFASAATNAVDFGGVYLKPLREELKIEDIKSFSISIKLKNKYNNPILLPSQLFLAIDNLKKCSTYFDEVIVKSGKNSYRTYELFFWVNKATKAAFQYYFKTAHNLYSQLYFLELLNIHLTGTDLRNIVKKAGAKTNISELLPKSENDKLVFSLKDIAFVKKGAKDVVYYRQLSDGEHQLLQVVGSILLMDAPGTLFLLDEPETHFNPDWRSKFVSLVNKCINKKAREQDIILTTHSPFIVSDCKPNKVFIFSRNRNGKLNPPITSTINTFGTSVNILTEEIFGKKESIADMSNNEIKRLKRAPMDTINKIEAVKEKSRDLGESVEKILLFRQLILRENELTNSND